MTPWLPPLRLWLRDTALALVLGACVLAPTLAQTIESVIRPGDVIQGHAKWEEECSKCHVRFDRAAQDRLCMDCHKEVGQDMRERSGYHGRLKPQACRACHTDHRGRAARIVELDKPKFDHAQTDYLLRGKHAKVECEKCHEPKKKYWQAASDCKACHRKDDVHKGSLGLKCADCHTENDWKEAKLDHDKTHFPLNGKHVDTKCVDCHRKGVEYKDAPRTCIGCHKKDDDGRKGHKGLYGEKCESCHGAKAWKPATFNHDTETKYALVGKHRSAKCADCHTGHLYKDKIGTTCIDCHRRDDDGLKGHKGSLGRDCAACHSERGWKEKGRFDHDKTKFPLLGKHVDTKCADCHKSTNYKEAPKDCYGCHKKDDKHEATLGTKCESCHIERDWKTTHTRFDHDKTKFRLRNAHAARKVVCKDCHSDLKRYRDTPMDCYACHKKDDKHEGQLSQKCDSCHSDRDWKVPRFDHSPTRFPLLGRHVPVKCNDCHKSLRYKDAPRDCWICHQKDDKHKLKFGIACESCHNARAWGLWDYDHAKRAKVVLDGAHRKLACEACHTRPAPKGKAAAELGTHCIACHRRDDVHDGAFGPVCEQCHSTDHWKRIRSRMGAAPERPRGGVDVFGHASRLIRGIETRRQL
ncbi:MAG: cytochrome c3 family protein [Burkholderiaceae bacterium]|nr:cytochrome c3 family protein [Burkholderiaceae bacterium]